MSYQQFPLRRFSETPFSDRHREIGKNTYLSNIVNFDGTFQGVRFSCSLMCEVEEVYNLSRNYVRQVLLRKEAKTEGLRKQFSLLDSLGARGIVEQTEITAFNKFNDEITLEINRMIERAKIIGKSDSLNYSITTSFFDTNSSQINKLESVKSLEDLERIVRNSSYEHFRLRQIQSGDEIDFEKLFPTEEFITDFSQISETEKRQRKECSRTRFFEEYMGNKIEEVFQINKTQEEAEVDMVFNILMNILFSGAGKYYSDCQSLQSTPLN